MICILPAMLAGHFAMWVARRETLSRDFGQVWYAAGAILRGVNPYDVIGPGKAFEWPAPLFYPLPAAFVGIPFAPLPYQLAMGAFVALGCAMLAWALTENGYAPLLALTSTCVVQAVGVAQWSPLLAGALVVTPLSVVLVAKPTIGLAVFAARPSWWAVGGAVALTMLAFLIHPHWFSDWRSALHYASLGPGKPFPYSAPVTLPGGVFALAALSRWRRPEARLLIALACVPQTLLPYEGVLLFLIPRGWWQMAALVTASYVMSFWWMRASWFDVDMATWIAIYGRGMVIFLYVPVTLMVLARPNEGAIAAALERAVARWPDWLRGRSLPT